MKDFLWTLFISMVPVIELRGGIPVGIGLGLSYFSAFLAGVIGNMLPIPFLLLFVNFVFDWIKKHIPALAKLVNWLEEKGNSKGDVVRKYELIGLAILVAIPLPGTGAWTGALVASVLKIPPKKAILPIFLGVLIAAAIVLAVSAGAFAIF